MAYTQHGSDLEPALLTPGQVATILGMSRSTVYEMLNSGALPSVRVLRSRKIRRTDLERLIQEGTGE